MTLTLRLALMDVVQRRLQVWTLSSLVTCIGVRSAKLGCNDSVSALRRPIARDTSQFGRLRVGVMRWVKRPQVFSTSGLSWGSPPTWTYRFSVRRCLEWSVNERFPWTTCPRRSARCSTASCFWQDPLGWEEVGTSPGSDQFAVKVLVSVVEADARLDWQKKFAHFLIFSSARALNVSLFT